MRWWLTLTSKSVLQTLAEELREGLGQGWGGHGHPSAGGKRRRPGFGLSLRAPGVRSLMVDGFPLVRFVVKARGPQKPPLWVQTSAGHCPPEDVGRIRGHFAPYSWGVVCFWGLVGGVQGGCMIPCSAQGASTSRDHHCKMPVMPKWGKPDLDYKEQWLKFAQKMMQN